MIIEKDKLPDDPRLLKEMLVDLDKRYTHLDEKYIDLDEKYISLEDKYKYLQRMFFGKKSEKLTPEDENQMRLFNEAEDGTENLSDDVSNETTAVETTQVKSHIRKKSGRKPLPEDLHREEIIHDLSNEDKSCPCCGKERPVIGEETTEELDIIPPKIIVNKHIRKKYGPCKCDNFFHEDIPEIKTAPMPLRLIPHSIASSGLIAYIVIAKYCDALPFYRQSKIFNRIDVDISRATLCNWAMLAAEKCKPLIKLMIEEIRSSPVIRMDETRIQVLNEQNKPAESLSYMWVSMGYSIDEKPLLLYQYHPTRSGDIPKQFLENYKGFLQTDGYAGYNKVASQKYIIHVSCFAHARRYFEKAWKGNKKSKVAYKGLKYIQKIYVIENKLRNENLKSDDFVEKRRNAVAPILEEFHNWLQSQQNNMLPQGNTGKAINYTLSEWSKLVCYLDHHLLTPDNNLIENAIRPFVIGRKNWLFSNTPRGADASAILYSLIESAKANDLEPYKYLRFLFDYIPSAKTKDEWYSLLPNRITSEMIKID